MLLSAPAAVVASALTASQDLVDRQPRMHDLADAGQGVAQRDLPLRPGDIARDAEDGLDTGVGPGSGTRRVLSHLRPPAEVELQLGVGLDPVERALEVRLDALDVRHRGTAPARSCPRAHPGVCPNSFAACVFMYEIRAVAVDDEDVVAGRFGQRAVPLGRGGGVLLGEEQSRVGDGGGDGERHRGGPHPYFRRLAEAYRQEGRRGG